MNDELSVNERVDNLEKAVVKILDSIKIRDERIDNARFHIGLLNVRITLLQEMVEEKK